LALDAKRAALAFKPAIAIDTTSLMDTA
jgi:hypothetical protein